VKYTAKWNPQLVKTYQEVAQLSGSKSAQIADARPTAKFAAGHIPGAFNVPSSAFVDPETKLFLSKEKLAELFTSKGVDLAKPVVTSCNSGVTAAVLYFGLELIGAGNIAMYDGSWTEYSTMPGAAISKI
jgi:thiosulfate/3-mercaptopyruvate sulfurtransferase